MAEGTRLYPKDHTDLREILRPASHKWETIGGVLGIEDLHIIKHRLDLLVGGTESFFSEMLSEWLKWAPPSHPWPTVEKLCSALRNTLVREEHLAYKLQQKYQGDEDLFHTGVKKPDIGKAPTGQSVLKKVQGVHVLICVVALVGVLLVAVIMADGMARKNQPFIISGDHCQHGIASARDLINTIAPSFNGEWKVLAHELDMKKNKITAIDRDEPTTDLKLRAMLHQWFDSRAISCWEDVLKALEKSGQGHLAGMIQRCLDNSNIPNCVNKEL